MSAKSVSICNTPNGDEQISEPKSLRPLVVAAGSCRAREVPAGTTSHPGVIRHPRPQPQKGWSFPRR